jgi:sugar lactone lactonase YvrE
MNNMFPTTAVGQSVQQTLQIHFDPSNLPVQTTPAPTITTSSFSIAPGISDFTINPIATSWTTQSGSGTMIGNTAFTSTATGGLTSLPLCTNLTGSVDTSLDCVVNVVFTPTAPGQRVSQLVVTTANGSVYNFALTGNATGSQLAIDGGAQAVVPVTGLGTTGQIAVTSNGTGYIADPTNNRIVVCTPAATCATQTTIGTGLKGPMGVAVDGANNVYISDTGNNRILKVNPITGVQTTLGAVLAVGSPAYPQYSFKGPQGIAVDTTGNVYVADTGNGKVVEIPSNPILGGATPLLSYPTAPFFSSPTTVSVDQYGNVYVVDPTAIQVLKLPPGGGDWQNLITTTSTKPDQGLPGLGTNLVAPIGGVAVDGGGNLYISDIATNAVYELPSATGPGSAQFQLSFYGVKSPGALALDSSGNLYLSDTGNGRVLFMNRTNPTVSFGTVPQDLSGASGVATANCPVAGSQTVCTGYLTVTNIGNQPITLTSPLTTVTGVSPTGDTAFNITNTCTSPLPAGLTCTISPTFLPTSDGQQTETVDVNGTQTMSLVANVTAVGEQPLANVVLTAGYSTGTAPTAGATATITATVTQPHLTGVTPTGTVTFTYVITGTNATCGSSGSVTVALVPGSGGASTASFPLPTLALGRQYTVNASYSGDSQSSFTLAAPLAIYVPGIPVTATSSSITFAYGTNPPTITGTVTGILPTDTGVTYAFGTAASATTPIGVYPITVTFSGTNSCNYGIPQVLTSSGAPATATETAAALNVKVNNATAPYGAANISYTSVITGNVNGDQFTETYVPAQSSILNVGTYSIVPTVGGLATQNYAVTATPGTLTITLAPTAVSVSAPKTSVLPTALSTAAIQVFAGTTVTAGKGTPTGTITVSDTFTPITATAPGTGPTVPACSVTVTSGCNATVTLPLVAGEVTYTPTSTTLGTHVYTFAYSGDSNFQPSNTTLSPTTLLVDNADFSLVSTTTPIQIAPGVIPGGNAAVAGEAAATPEQATVSVTSILSLSGLISLSCTPQNPTYVSCSLAPPSVTLTGSTTAVTSTLSVSTPATLPLGFTFSSELRRSGEKTVLAFLPFGVLAFCLRKRKRLSKALWMLIAIGVVSSGISACGGNSVHDYVPVPAGAQSVTIYASGTSTTTNTVVTRSFVVPINIQ